MQLKLQKAPQAGDVPSEGGGVLPDAVTNLDSENSDTRTNLTNNSINHLHEMRSVNHPTSAYQVKTLNTDSSCSSNPSKTHVLRSSRKLLHRCPFRNCCKENRSSGQYSRSVYRNTSNSCSSSTLSIVPNIPLENQEQTAKTPYFNVVTRPSEETAKTPYFNVVPRPSEETAAKTPYFNVVPRPSQVSGAPGTWPFYSNDYHHHHQSSNPPSYNCSQRWQANIPYHNANTHNNALPEVNNRIGVLARGIQSTFPSQAPHHQQDNPRQEQQQQLQQKQPLQAIRVQPYYRKRAINYMMTHLQLRGSENDAALVAVRKRIEGLENQIYTSANSKEHYVNLLAIKLGAIMERLYTRHPTRPSHRQNHHTPALPTAHQPPTCV